MYPRNELCLRPHCDLRWRCHPLQQFLLSIHFMSDIYLSIWNDWNPWEQWHPYHILIQVPRRTGFKFNLRSFPKPSHYSLFHPVPVTLPTSCVNEGKTKRFVYSLSVGAAIGGASGMSGDSGERGRESGVGEGDARARWEPKRSPSERCFSRMLLEMERGAGGWDGGGPGGGGGGSPWALGCGGGGVHFFCSKIDIRVKLSTFYTEYGK